jgi:hypothetical protein
MIAPGTLQAASIMASPGLGAALYEFDGQILWLPKYNKRGFVNENSN